MNGVTFGNYHSYNDLSMIMNSKEIGSPEIKQRLVDVEGADGVLDYTEYFGETKYSNRTLKFDFSAINQDDFMGFFSGVQDKLHGQKMQIILGDDTNYYYYGRISVQPFTKERNIGRLSIECDCEPYKMKASETTVSRSVSGSASITLTNSRKTVVPTITTTASMTFSFDGSTYSSSAGTFVIPEIALKEGNNVIGVTGTGTVTFKYREGRL